MLKILFSNTNKHHIIVKIKFVYLKSSKNAFSNNVKTPFQKSKFFYKKINYFSFLKTVDFTEISVKLLKNI